MCLMIMNGCFAYNSYRELLNETPFLTAAPKKALYIMCQVASSSTVYKVYIEDGRLECHDKTLTPHCIIDTFSSGGEYSMMERPLPWHFVCCNDNIYAAPRLGNELYMCNLRSGALCCKPAKMAVQMSITLVLQVGHEIIALSDTLRGVYRLSHTQEWTYRSTYGYNLDLKRKVNLSGYVVLSDDSFVVYDSDSGCFFSHDLQVDRWSVVMSLTDVTKSLPHEVGHLPCVWSGSGLCGRSVFVNGFIYTCTLVGLLCCL